jgi:DNA-binding beta-propeller fold protein YncE
MIFYGGTAAGTGSEDEGVQFFAYDVKNRKLLYAGPDGPARYLAFARSTGRVYYTAGKERDGPGGLMRYDPAAGGRPVRIPGTIGIRAATQETPQGVIYTVSLGQGGRDAHLYALDTKTEAVRDFGPAAGLSNSYVASLDADPTGRYLYYVPGAHGGSAGDGSAVIQFDVTTGKKKVIAFLHPFYQKKYACTPAGTYGTAVDPAGDTLYVTWNVNRGGRAWDCCALTAIHIPAAERRP